MCPPASCVVAVVGDVNASLMAMHRQRQQDEHGRPAVQQWTQWPAYILFDGRPYETYNDTSLKKVFFVSDSYVNYYSNNKDSLTTHLTQLATKVHNMNKLLRLWGTPDNPSSWEMLLNSGVDIINTDKVADCRNYFLTKHQ